RASMPGRGVRCDRRRRKTRPDERRNNKFRRDKAGNPPLRLPMAPAAEEPLLLRPSKVVDNRVYARKSGECRMNESSRRATASAVSLLLLLAPASAAAQQQGGMLRIAHRDSPASMSTPEEVTTPTVAPMMAVFSNLVVFDQHAPQDTRAFIALLASGYSPVYPCHVPPQQIRQHPIGTGPFKFDSYKPNESIRLTRNPDYWKPGRPYLDGIEWTIIPNRSTALLARIIHEA